jgi:3-deoxy-D-manno-octulosonate 8-phosphate phosphatase (KDO 8-P phosphatase)
MKIQTELKLVKNIDSKLLRNLKALILDVDGVLTNGGIFMDAAGQWRRTFHIHDGLGIKKLLQMGLHIAWITGSESPDISERAKNLGVQNVFQGVESKLPVAEKFMIKNQLQWEEMAYMGDDLPDLPVLNKVGCPVTVPNAHELVLKNKNFYLTQNPGGSGAVREICDLIEAARNQNL